jgi:hypothetical protein
LPLWTIATVLAAHLQAEEPCASFPQALSLAQTLRGLPFVRPVACHVLEEEAFQSALTRNLAAKLKENELLFEDLVYKNLGFIPVDFDYKACVVKIYYSETGAFYRQEENDCVLSASQGADLVTTVHELTHALQDQHFGLKTLTEASGISSDELLAKLALIEGDAALVEEQAAEAKAPAPLKKAPPGRLRTKDSCELPLELQQLLAFSYDFGPGFVRYLKQRGGYEAVNQALKAPPASTAAILHPERYLHRLKGDSVASSFPLDPQMGEVLFSDQLGEFFLRIFLAMHMPLSQASKLAEHWRADRVVLGKPKEGGVGGRISWSILWDSKESAMLFGQKLLERFGKTHPTAVLDKDISGWTLQDAQGYIISYRYHDAGGLLSIKMPPSL